MDSNSILTLILSNLNEKYKHLNRIFEATKGLECVDLDDEISLSSFLSTRQTAMNNIDKLDAGNKKLLQSLPASLRSEVSEYITPNRETTENENIPDIKNPVCADIFKMNSRNLLLLRRIIEADKRFNKNVQRRRSAAEV